MIATAVALISTTALIGWWTGHAALAAWLPGIVDMSFNTALGLMLVAMACCVPTGRAKTCRTIRLSVAVLVGLFATLSLTEDLFGLQLGIDNILFDSQKFALNTMYPGRMSPMTAVGFILCATILTLLNHQKRQVHIVLTHVLILLLTLLALLGIGMGLFPVNIPVPHVYLASTSLFTAIAFLLLAISLLRIFQTYHTSASTNMLLYSGIQLMYKLKYPQKFALISIVFVAPLSFLMWDELNLYKQRITDAKLKFIGIHHIEETLKLTKAIPEHRGMANARFIESTAFGTDLEAKTEEVDQLLAELASMDRLHAASIDVPDEWQGIIARWNKIKSRTVDSASSWLLHTEMIALLHKHLRDVGNQTLLSYESDPGTHNILEAQIEIIPDLLEKIGQLRGLGAGFMIKKDVTYQDQIMLTALVSDIELLSRELGQLLNKNNQIHLPRSIQNDFSKFTSSSKAFVSIAGKQLIWDKLFSIPAEDYFALGTAAIQYGNTFSLSNTAYIERRLNQRITASITAEYRIRVMAMAVIMILFFLFAAFYRSVMNTITALKHVLGKVQRGEIDMLDKIPASDEMGDIIGSFDTIANELAQVNSHMSAIVNYAAEAIITIDSCGVVYSFNPAAEHLFGYRAGDVIGKNITMLMPEKFRSQHEAGLQNYRKSGHSQVIETRKDIPAIGLKKDTSEFPMELSISSVTLNGQQMFVGMLRDVSQRESLESQLRQAQKMEAVGALVGGVAHNFNNLLAGILGKAYLARRKAQDKPEVLSYLESIEAISSQAGDMVKQLLTFAHKDFFRDQQDMPLSTLVKEAFKTASLGMPEDIKIDLQIMNPNIIVHCDANQVQQVLMNMMNNARDAMEDSADKQISVRLEFYSPDSHFFQRHKTLAVGNYACLSIADSGHGMDTETVGNIFDPFFTTKEVGKGTGLGLSTAFGTITSHHGVIEVDSHIGHGTVFRIYLPMMESTVANIKEDDVQVPLRSLNHETLLLVDDEPLLLHSMKEVLEDLGYNVITACNGAQGLECFLKHQHIDAIITDVTMPVMSGMDMFRQIRSTGSHIPVIFITGYDQNKIQLSTDEQANTLILAKPLQIPDLSQHVESMLTQ